MTHEDVQAWLDRYVAAWRSYDPELIGELFSPDAEYRYTPWDDPVRGREAIVQGWLGPEGDQSGRDAPGTYDARYAPFVVEGDRAVATGTTDYFSEPGGPRERRFHNVFLLEFDDEGRCRRFTEVYALEHRG